MGVWCSGPKILYNDAHTQLHLVRIRSACSLAYCPALHQVTGIPTVRMLSLLAIGMQEGRKVASYTLYLETHIDTSAETNTI